MKPAIQKTPLHTLMIRLSPFVFFFAMITGITTPVPALGGMPVSGVIGWVAVILFCFGTILGIGATVVARANHAKRLTEDSANTAEFSNDIPPEATSK